MRNKRGFKHYVKFYLLILAVYFIYVSILAINNKGYDPFLLFSVLYLPILFIFFVFLFDTLLDPIFNRLGKSKPNDANLYKEFFLLISSALSSSIFRSSQINLFSLLILLKIYFSGIPELFASIFANCAGSVISSGFA